MVMNSLLFDTVDNEYCATVYFKYENIQSANCGFFANTVIKTELKFKIIKKLIEQCIGVKVTWNEISYFSNKNWSPGMSQLVDKA